MSRGRRMMSKYPFVQQHDEKDCGAACLSMISEYYGLKLPIAVFRDLIQVDNQGANIYGLTKGAGKIGLNADALSGTFEELIEEISNGEIQFPFVARIVNKQVFEHFIVVYAIRKGIVIVGDSGENRITKMPVECFKEQWQGQIITFLPDKNFEKGDKRKGAFKKFFKLLAGQKKLLTFVIVMSVLISLINVSGALIFKTILSDDAFTNIKIVCMTIILMYILRSILHVLRGFLLAESAKRVDVSLTLSYYNHLIDLPAAFHGSRKTGEFMSRFYDTAKIRDAISTTVLTIVLDTVMAVGCGVLLYCVNVKLFLITLGIVVIYGFIMCLFRTPIRDVNHELMEKDAQVTSFLKESIDGIETVKVYQYEPTVKKQSEKLYMEFADKNVKGTLIYNLQESIISAVASIGIVVLLWVGAYLCMNKVISIADLFTFYYLIDYFLEPISNLLNLQPELQTAIVAGERLNDILDVAVERDDAEKMEMESVQGNIKFEHVDFRYGNRELVLRDVTMAFEKGKKTAIVGESGCGKTTIAKLLLALYNPENGMITMDGKNLINYTISSRRQHVAYIAQDIFLFADTIYNNLKFGNDNVTEEEIKDVCKLCRAHEFIERLPMGYGTMLEENGSNLSGGQKQRLAIARALLRKPDILIMDEATSNLDTITEESIRRTIDELSKQMTCIIIAHRMNTIKNCDYIYVMDNGKIVEEGTHRSLMNCEGVYKKLVGSS